MKCYIEIYIYIYITKAKYTKLINKMTMAIKIEAMLSERANVVSFWYLALCVTENTYMCTRAPSMKYHNSGFSNASQIQTKQNTIELEFSVRRESTRCLIFTTTWQIHYSKTRVQLIYLRRHHKNSVTNTIYLSIVLCFGQK